MTIAVEIVSLSKRYRVGRFEGSSRYRTLRDTLAEVLSAPWRLLRGRSQDASYFWALKNVSIAVEQGRALGVVGRNGAGKSTLLKILSRVTEPTTGHAVVRGRVASLLEVGTGFHPELTGRENIFLNGAILGMTRAEMRARFDEIVDFAEVERFIDTPVKHYSSGMRMRLAFAVAAHLDPEILIIDEVLAVGDSQFQRKCLGRMESAASDGRTVIFVSHNLAAVRRLCSQGVLLREGEVVQTGPVEEVLDTYLADVRRGAEITFDHAPTKAAQVTRLCIRNVRGEKTGAIDYSEPFTTEIEYIVRRPLTGIHLWWQLSTADGIEVAGSGEADSPDPIDDTRAPGRYIAQATFPGGVLNEGAYQYRVAIGPVSGEMHDYRYGTYFEIRDDTKWATATIATRRHGVILQRLLWRDRRVE